MPTAASGFRTIQDCPKDLTALPVQPKPPVRGTAGSGGEPMLDLRRRQFITLMGGAAAWPLAARAQQAAMPVIGFLHPASPDANADRVRAFRLGLRDAGMVESHNVAIEYRWANNQIDRLPEMAEELVGRQVAAIIAISYPAAFALFGPKRPDALFVGSATFLMDRRVQLALLAAAHKIPATCPWRDFVEAGGLISYGASLRDAYSQTGIYAARILKGAKPAELPVMQSTRFELVINAQTARILGLTVPQTLLATADEVIE